MSHIEREVIDALQEIKNLREELEHLKAVSLTRISAARYTLGDILYFTASSTFDKTNFPGLKAVKVKVQAGGGGGGGAASTGAGQESEGSGGGGGGYGEKFIPASDLAASEIVTVGAGGPGSLGSAVASNGGVSSFGSHITGNGGVGGVGMVAVASNAQRGGGGGAGGSGGDFHVIGSDGSSSSVRGGLASFLGGSGGSHLGGSVQPPFVYGINGRDGFPYGGGGSGARNGVNDATVRTGGAGAPGIVIVELYY